MRKKKSTIKKGQGQKKLSLEKELLKFFPQPSRMGEPIPTLWERPSDVRPKERQIVRNSY